MRDIIITPLDEAASLVIAADNSGGIGMKPDDIISVPYEVLGYYSTRVALMECMAVGGNPMTVVLQNFCGQEAWNAVISGAHQALNELDIQGVTITGSTESNFELLQSALGAIVIGKKANQVNLKTELDYSNELGVALIGLPLIGDEVIQYKSQVAPLSLFRFLCEHADVEAVIPVGSRGVLFELNQVFPCALLNRRQIHTEVVIEKSSGPSTCFIAVFKKDAIDQIKAMAGSYFHSIRIKSE
ncbi:ATP-binding protein [Peribacillus saganii]|uniref:ATP-binding protein n=1 Tax=Peribacillus saganii TaxID=2303992 RepID=A0A372LT69_9BACI|nr:ATP-binding protein [Peribacillus saganii]RFU71415.1 ATP-binding protein [Peribacillus saganii]